MVSHKQSVMIALLPSVTDWCKIEIPHMTLVYCGEIADLSPTDYNEMGKAVLEMSRQFAPISLDVLGVEVFGDNEDPVDVLVLNETPELRQMRSRVEHWNASEHPFNPHATVGPVGSVSGTIPNKLLFTKISLSWGDGGFNSSLSPSGPMAVATG